VATAPTLARTGALAVVVVVVVVPAATTTDFEEEEEDVDDDTRVVHAQAVQNWSTTTTESVPISATASNTTVSPPLLPLGLTCLHLALVIETSETILCRSR
jgi:hypothetical protein